MSEKKKQTAATQEVGTQAAGAQTAAKTVQAVKADAAGPLMYVGPTVTGLAIQNRVYTKIPEDAGNLIKEHPELRNLFIPVRDYPKANRMIREGTGYIYSAYLAALELRR